MIEVQKLSKTYNVDDTKALSDVSFKIDEKSIMGVMGKNGSGKTSLIKSILKQHTHLGEIKYSKDLLTSKDQINLDEVYFVSDSPHLYDYLTAAEYVKFVLSVKKKNKKTSEEKIIKALRLFGVTVGDLKKLLKDCSFGTRRKVVLAAGFLVMPKLFVLDEPALGLDVPSVIHLKKMISKASERGVTFIVCSHDPALIAEICDALLILHEGKPLFFTQDMRTVKKDLATFYLDLIESDFSKDIEDLFN